MGRYYKDSYTKANRIALYVLSFLSLLLAIYLYYEFKLLGFPDGHLTKLELVLKNIYPFYILFAILFMLYFYFLAWNNKQRRTRIKPKLAILFFITYIGVILYLNYYLALQFSNGGGG